jgi:hypothetical protein
MVIRLSALHNGNALPPRKFPDTDLFEAELILGP